MSCPREARKRSKTISFWVTPAQADEIDRLARLSGYTKQDYLARRALGKQVVVVPSSRVVKLLRESAAKLSDSMFDLAEGACVDEALMDELRWLAGLMASFARYGEEDFDAVERIVTLERE